MNSDTSKKVLILQGGWEGHEPELCRDIFVPWMRSLKCWPPTISCLLAFWIIR